MLNRQAIYVTVDIEARSCNQLCCGKSISIKYSVWVFVALVIQHAMRMRRNVFWGLSGCAVFFTLSNIQHIFEKSFSTYSVFWFHLHLLPEKFFILRIPERDTIKIYIGLHAKQSLFLSYSDINFMKIRLSGSQDVPCGWTNRRTERFDDANSRFSQSCERA
jgi:hypothetical protein